MEQLDRRETQGGLWPDYQSSTSAAKEDKGPDLWSGGKPTDLSNMFFE